MKGGRAKDCDTHYCGGPDFLVEIISTHDQSRAKLPFYSQIGVREVMIIDRDPWCLELYRLEGGELRLVGKSQLDASAEFSERRRAALVPSTSRPAAPADRGDASRQFAAVDCLDANHCVSGDAVMATLITDPGLQQQLLAERVEWGGDIFDEVWEGTYIMTPSPNLEHQDISTGLVTVFRVAIDWPGLGKVYHVVNVSDREQGWKRNYRVPDIAVALNGTQVRFCDTHFCGGPDLVVEIVSPYDLSRDKLKFYGTVGVREVMLIDRDPWCLELYRLDEDELRLFGKSRLDEPALLSSAVVPLSFRLLPGQPRPQIEVTHRDGVQRWIV